MTKRRTTRSAISKVSPRRFAFLQGPVHAAMYKRLASAFNGIQARMGKCFLFSGDTPSPSGTGAGVTKLQHFRVRTSPNTSELRFEMSVLPTTNDIDVMVNPRVRVRVLEPDQAEDSDQLTGAIGLPEQGSVVALTDVAWGTVSVSVSGSTEYIGWVEAVDGGRMFSVCGFEHTNGVLDDSSSGVCDSRGYVDEGPILSTHFEDLVHANNTLPDAMGAHLISWTTNEPNSTPTLSNTGGDVNVFDDGITSVTDTSPGFRVDLTNCGDINGNVKCRFAARCVPGNSNGSNALKLEDINDGNIATLSTWTETDPDETNDWGWRTEDITLEAKEYKFDVLVNESGGADFRVDAFYLYPHPHD